MDVTDEAVEIDDDEARRAQASARRPHALERFGDQPIEFADMLKVTRPGLPQGRRSRDPQQRGHTYSRSATATSHPLGAPFELCATFTRARNARRPKPLSISADTMARAEQRSLRIVQSQRWFAPPTHTSPRYLRANDAR